MDDGKSKEMKKIVEFVNGFENWHETHFEVVSAITQELRKDPNDIAPVVAKRQLEQGTGGMYELAQELTDKFEELNKGRYWDGEYYDEIEEFMEKELNKEE